jgi:hypothetical protein
MPAEYIFKVINERFFSDADFMLNKMNVPDDHYFMQQWSRNIVETENNYNLKMMEICLKHW